MSEPTLIERLQHFEDHSKEAGDGYGAEVLYRARERITQLEEENERKVQTIKDAQIESAAEYIIISLTHDEYALLTAEEQDDA